MAMIAIKLKAKVPGSIHSDLRREGILKQDIYVQYNDIDYQWVSLDNWTFVKTFTVDSNILNKKTVNLLAKGIDTISNVFINDKLIGKTNNQFVRYKFNVKQVLKLGQNTIRIAIQSAPAYIRQQYNDFKQKYNYTIPSITANNYAFIRKMAASFGWDWGPSFPTQGIWKDIGLEVYDTAIVRDIVVDTKPVNKSMTRWSLNLIVFLESIADHELMGLFDISLDENVLITKQRHILKTNSMGECSVKFDIEIPDNIPITVWYPNGVANDTQKLYKLTVNVSVVDNNDNYNTEEVSAQTKKIGFRTIRLVQQPIRPKGLTFYFEVNGLPFYAKGTNWIPAHNLLDTVTDDYIRHLLVSTKEANMNMMRVWGGGVYETDYFYELADELGIMIWQDMMFACAPYPANQEYLETVDLEVRQQLRRLENHPSIAIWSGNNEIQYVEEIIYRNNSHFIDDYYNMFIKHIKTIVDNEDLMVRPFVSSSPSNGLQSVKDNYTSSRSANDYRYGDVHYYNYNSPLWNWTVFPSGKFVSEYGFQSYPSLETLSQAFLDNDFTYPLSKAVQRRQQNLLGYQSIETMSARYFKMPSNGLVDRFNDFVYLSQITQAMAIKSETEFYRRNRDIDDQTGNGYTMGALYWQLNDIWQAPTWASIESNGKWKVLHSYAKQFFNNLLVVPYEDNNQLKVSVVNDYYSKIDYNFSIKVYKWSQNKPIYELKDFYKSDSFSAKVVYSKPIVDLLTESKCLNRNECLLSFEVNNFEHKLQSNNFMLLTEPKNSKLIKPNIKVLDVKKGGINDKTFIISLSSETIAPFVLLDFRPNSEISGQFMENGFFIFDGQKSIIFKSNSQLISEQQIKDKLIVKTVTDVI
ncbi:beta-mannosidase-like [Oppia nitens]|uniref:beta-mannosidase-like n=1 Tax=Oppia nitens TaxID=1686743 RepID=UPI0023D9925D|nr:beta-mannosidase-like [Oppia nitens]